MQRSREKSRSALRLKSTMPADRTQTEARHKRSAPARPSVGKRSPASIAQELRATSTGETPDRGPTACPEKRKETPRRNQLPRLRATAPITGNLRRAGDFLAVFST